MHVAAILLIVGAALSLLRIFGTEGEVAGAIAQLGFLVLSGAVAWLGLLLFMGTATVPQLSPRYRGCGKTLERTELRTAVLSGG